MDLSGNGIGDSGAHVIYSGLWQTPMSLAISARDENIPLLEKTEAEQLAEEHAALLLAAQVRLRTAQEALDAAPWYARWAASRDVRRAEEELAEVKASAPPTPRGPSALDGFV